MPELAVGGDLKIAVAKALGCSPVFSEKTGHWQCLCDGGRHITKHVNDEQGDWYELANYPDDDCDALAALDEAIEKHQTPEWDDIYNWVEISGPLQRWHDKPTPVYWLCHFHGLIAPQRGTTRAEAISRAIVALGEKQP